jgi:hypothetical protein
MRAVTFSRWTGLRHQAEVVTPAADAGVDDDEVYGLRQLPDAGRGHHGALADVERRYLVREVDDARLRTRAVDDGVADAHPRVFEAEVRHEPDDLLHGRLPEPYAARRRQPSLIISSRNTILGGYPCQNLHPRDGPSPASSWRPRWPCSPGAPDRR